MDPSKISVRARIGTAASDAAVSLTPSAPPQALMLRQAQLLQTVYDAWHQPRDTALAALYDAYDALVSLDERLLGPAGANALLRVGHYVRVFDGRSAIAIAALDRAERWARRHDDPVLLTFVLTQRGAAWDSDAVLGPCLRHFSEALATARPLHTRQPECSALLHLGQRLADAGLHAEAAQCFHRCLESMDDARGGVWDEYRRICVANLSWTSILAGRYEDAIGHLDRWFVLAGHSAEAAVADAAADHGPDMREIAIAYTNRATALLGLGRDDEALVQARRSAEWAERSQSSYVQCGADLAYGRALVATGSQDDGLALVQRSVERARSEVPRQLLTALQTAAAVYERAGETDSARMYLHELYLLKRRTRDELIQSLAQDVGHQLEREAGLQALTLPPIHEDRPDAVRIGAPARASIAKLNLVLEEHAVAAERLDDTTGAHCYRVGRMAALLGHEIGLGDDTCFLLEISARLHDVGKLMVPDELLMKPGRLTPAERQIVQRHTVAGWEILGKTAVPQVHIAQEIARHHHEWWDGSGYPDALAGDAIPISARVSALADVFDALTHVRPYKPAWPVEEALAEIESLKGVQFDPELTDIFIALVHRLQAEHGDLDRLLGEAASRSNFVEAREEMARLLKGVDPSQTAFTGEQLTQWAA